MHITTIDLTAYCFLRTWFTCLDEKGFDVTLATTVQEFRDDIEKSGARVVNIPIARSAHPVKDFISLVNLFRFIRKEQFDVVHTYTTKAGFVGRLAARLAGVPIIVHTIFELPQNSARNPVLKFLYKTMEQVAALWADYFITISTFNRNQILENHIVPETRLALIPEGLSLEKYEAAQIDSAKKRQELGIPGDAIILGTVARLEAAKGHEYLLEAAKIILEKTGNEQDIYFLLVGRGRLLEELESKAAELGVSGRVKFLGFREDMLEIVQTFDMFVLPSLWEGQGVVLMEAMCYKKPIVASKVGGITDVVEDGVSGVLVPPRDPEALAEAILSLLNSHDRMKQLGEAGYERVKTKFQDKDANKKRLDVYRKLFKEMLWKEI